MPAEKLPGQNCLPLQTLFNVRDLGGYPAEGGRQTAYGRFLRADAPVRLNQADLQWLLDFPVRTVIDLRSPSEFRGMPHGLRDIPAIDYRHIPLAGDDLDAAITAMSPFAEDRPSVELPDFYISLLEHFKDNMRQIFLCLVQAGPGAVLFHCSHGKDRAGLVAALLLLLAGVSDADIIDNYQVSYSLLKPWFDTFIHNVPAEFMHFFNTDPENMELTLRYFHQHYVSAAEYLASCGFAAGDIESLRLRLLQ